MSAHEAQLRRALETIRKLRTRLDSVENAPRESIAIVGIGCRFPGAEGPDAFWRMLSDGVDAVTAVPKERWDVDEYYDPQPGAPGKMYTRSGAFLPRADSFDAGFFGIAPREASAMDPQQRLLLEVAWEALENAGHASSRLSGSDTGVFIGISTNDYSLLSNTIDAERIDAYAGTGTAFNVAAGRIAYFLGLHGPCLAVDTACSSSLVAVHLACQNLRARKCRMALAGGVNLILAPMSTIYFCQMRALARDGRCKAFDESADGYGRGEGCGVVVLKRLSDAIADGDRILAVIRGSAINHDGRSSGLTVPNGPAQQAVIREALADAGVDAGDISLIEAHGTGTPLGDPIELGALAAALGQGRAPDGLLTVGSVKTNFGHLEAAAGVAGLIKLVLALQHREIPPHLHFNTPSSHIPWAQMPIRIPTALQKWTPSTGRRLAGVSSFGFSGTNAHVTLEEAPLESASPNTVDRPLHVLCISARNDDALNHIGRRYSEHLSGTPDSFADIAATSSSGRIHFTERLAVVAESAPAAGNALSSYFEGQQPANLHRGSRKRRPEIAFLFTGQGSQYIRMAQGLYQTQPEFQRLLDRCDELLAPRLERRLLSVIFPNAGEASVIDETGYTQPALFALEYCLAELWRSWGVEPAAVLGHSVGEYVAACVAGMFSLEEGLALICERARLMQVLPAGGAMASVFAGETRIADAIAAHQDRLAIAAINGPQSTVISGDARTLDGVLQSLKRAGVASQKLTVSHAFHSPLMDPMLDEFEAKARLVQFQASRLPFIWNVSGDASGPDTSKMPDYWRKHARMPVRFMDSIRNARRLGCDVFLEIGPSPVLSTLGRKCFPADDSTVWLATLRRGSDDWKTILDSVARLYVAGADIDWPKFDRPYRRRKVSLPTYAFQHQRYWFDDDAIRKAPAPPESEGEVYEIQWIPAAPREKSAVDPGAWLVVTDSERAPGLCREFEDRGHRTIVSAPTPSQTLGAEATQYKGIVVLLEKLPGAERCEVVLLLAQALARLGTGAPLLYVITRNAQPAGPEPHAIFPDDALLWGLGRGIVVEHPGVWGGIIDGDDDARNNPGLLVDSILTRDGEDQTALYGGVRYVPRLDRIHNRRASAEIRFSDNGTYLITGGLGALGLALIRWMIERGARALAVTGRSAATDTVVVKRLESLRDLDRYGATIEYAQVDVTDEPAMAGLLQDLKARAKPLRGVIHAAGVSASRLLSELDITTMRDVLAPKVKGAWNLQELTKDISLDFFVLFSSIASTWGSKGLAHYAAANSFLDALAWYRRAQGLTALSLNWGPWAGEGMASGETALWLERTGVNALLPEEALHHLSEQIQTGATQVTIARVDWKRFVPLYEARMKRPFLERLSVSQRKTRTASGPAQGELVERLRHAHAGDRRNLVAEHLRKAVSRVLGFDPSAPFPLQQGFFEIGMDSLTAVELRNRLEADFGQSLRATLAIDFPTIDALSDHLLRDVLDFESAEAAVKQTFLRPDMPGEPIAIIGLGCRFPAGASDPESFWRLLRDGTDAMVEVPKDRWDLESVFDPQPDTIGKMYTRYGAFLDRVDHFDASFFSISPREAMNMDPQQRLLLEVAWEALEHAGQSPVSLKGSPTGVFIGISGNDYAQIAGSDGARVDAYFGSGNSLSAAAGRISFALGLQGPSMSVDTACSSSLAALHLACRSLQSGESLVALAGGVNLMLTPSTYINLSRARMLAPDGRCKTFDAAADGYARGEGCGVVVLKRLSDALENHDRILAVIRGTAVNQDGHSGGFTVPNGPAQEKVIRAALAAANIDPALVDYVEAHGTGTSLGDPIEVQALAAVLGQDRDPNQPLVIGSVKTNIGHLEAASGVAGLIKVILGLTHEEIPRHLHFNHPSPHIPWKSLPVRVAADPVPWPRGNGHHRLAGVSSFGFVGTNAHVVLEEAPSVSTNPAVDRPFHILPISARDDRTLQELVNRYIEFFKENVHLSLADVCHTAGAGRSHFECRAAIAVQDAESDTLHHTLLACANGENRQGLYRATSERTGPLRAAFVFSGEAAAVDAQRGLYETQPLYKQHVDTCRELFDKLPHKPDPKRAEQFTLHYSLAQLWRSWGIEPSIVVADESQYAAACIAGVYTLEEAVDLQGGVREVSPRKSRIPICSQVPNDGCDVVEIDALSASWDRLIVRLAQLYVDGATVNWDGFDRGYERSVVTLPTYPFQRKRFWPEVKTRDNTPARHDRPQEPVHPLLGRKLSLPFSRETRFESQFHRHAPAYLDDHRLFGTVVVPGASHVVMALEAAAHVAGTASYVLEDLVFPQALVLSDDDCRPVQFILAADGASRAFQIVSQNGPGDDSWAVHATGRLRVEAQHFGSVESIDEIRNRCDERFEGSDFYRTFSEMGYTLGSSFRWIADGRRRAGEALCRLDPPTDSIDAIAVLHPGLLDSCFQLLSCCHDGKLTDIGTDDSMFIPFTIREVRMYEPLRQPYWCHAVLRTGRRPAEEKREGDIRLFDRDGNVVADVRGFESRRVSRQALSAASRAEPDTSKALPYTISWQAAAASSATAVRGRWLIFDESDAGSSFGQTLGSLLEDRGGVARHAVPADGLAGDDLTCDGIVFLQGLQGAPADSYESFCTGQRDVCSAALRLVQRLAAAKPPAPAVWLVTRGACATDGSRSVVDPTHATLWGLARTAVLEAPHLRCITIDLDPEIELDAQAAALLEHLVIDREPQIALRGGRALVPRLVPLDVTSQSPVPLDRADANYRLESTLPGVLQDLAFRPSVRRAPQPGEVEIRVNATGLNFRDVLAALNLYPGVIPFGGECAGTVVRCGDGVENFRAGDRVMAFASDSFGAFVTVAAEFVSHLPPHISFAEGATIPAAYLTAHYGLCHLARISAGQRVLIHAAAGGVGMAAVRIAQLAGAEVFATAGSAEKREFLRSLGIRHVFDSRNLSFARDIRAVIGGNELDIVLNSLSDEFIPQSLSLLRQDGCFLEIGKRGIWSREQVARVRPDVNYLPYDLEQAGRLDPHLLHEMFGEIVQKIRDKRLTALPSRVFDWSEVSQAFRFMAQARHIGKVVVTQPADRSSLLEHATYLITGGTGALGVRVAKWMIDRGARHMVLTARHAPVDLSAIDDLRSRANVVVAQADVSRMDEMSALFDRIDATLPPLRGVVHAAGVIDDAVLAEQSWERFAKVFAAKTGGARILHELTRRLSLDFFVLFSSMASTFGSPGQANYAAANAYLDALAQYRRSEGLPASALNWGPWADAGMAAHIPTAHQVRRKSQGVGTLAVDDALQLFGKALLSGAPQVIVLAMDWPKFLSQYRQESEPSFFSALKLPSRNTAAHQSAGTLKELLERAAESKRYAILADHVRMKAAEVLGLKSSEPLPPRRPLIELGLDSLMAVELRNALALGLECTLPATLIFDFPTLEALTVFLANDVLKLLKPHAGEKQHVASAAAAAGTATREAEAIVGELSNEDLEAIISGLAAHESNAGGNADG